MKNFVKKNIYLLLALSILVLVISLCSIFNPIIYVRFGYTFKAFFESFVFYIKTIFHVEENGSINFLPFFWVDSIKLGGSTSSPVLPPDFILVNDVNLVKLYFQEYFSLFFNMANFKKSFSFFVFLFTNLSLIIFCVLSLFLIYKAIENFLFSKKDPSKVGFTRTYMVYEKLDNILFNKIKSFFVGWNNYLSENSSLRNICILVFLFYTNILTCLIDLFSYALVFFSSFRFEVVYYALYTTLLTEWSLIKSVPVFIWLIIIYCIFDYLRYKKAINHLSVLDYKNRDFVENQTGVINIIKGAPGVGKTMFLTDLGKTTEQSYRYDLLDILNKNESYFSNFNIRNFEMYINYLKAKHIVNNQSEIEDLVDVRKKMFLNSMSIHSSYINLKNYLFGYDFKKFGLNHWNGLYYISFFDFLKTYGSAYFYYISINPLIYSNYSIRFDCMPYNSDYFPLWSYDYFTIKKELINDLTHYSHILNLDTLRLGKKFNPDTSILGFGVVCFTEFDKERGNQLSNTRYRKDDEMPNPLNDDLTKYLKLSRQVATIDYKPFFKMFVDLQRTGDLSLGNVEISECVIKIQQKEKKNILTLWKIEPIICEYIINFRNKFINQYRSSHNYYGLIVRFVNAITLPFKNYLERRSNLFGYSKLLLEINSGDDEKDKRDSIYYLLDKKILARSYSTDTHYGFFKESLNKWKTSIDDVPCYSGLRATGDEILQQNSYLGNDLNNSFRNHKGIN